MIWTLVFIIAAGQGLFLSILLFAKKSKNLAANRYLGALLALYSLNMLENVTYWTQYQLEIPHIINTTQDFIFLFGPLLLLYFQRAVQQDHKLTWLSSIHLIPFLLSVWSRIDFFLLSTEQKITIASQVVQSNSIGWNQISYPLAVSIHLSIYIVLVWNLLDKSNKKLPIVPLLRQIARSFSVYVSVIFVYFVLYFSIDFNTIHDYMISLAAAFFMYQIGYISFTRPEKIHDFSIKAQPSQKYHKSGVKESEADRYSDEVLQLMNTEQIYLKHELRIADVAKMLGISVNHLSQIVNERLHKSFNELVNGYRVKKAIELLSDPENNDKMLTVAFKCGFNNKTSFNTIFKRHTQVSPMSFRNKVKSKVSV